jgi:hypothetical protein
VTLGFVFEKSFDGLDVSIRIVGITQNSGVGSDDRTTGRHRLKDRQAEPLVKSRKVGDGGPFVESVVKIQAVIIFDYSEKYP